MKRKSVRACLLAFLLAGILVSCATSRQAAPVPVPGPAEEKKEAAPAPVKPAEPAAAAPKTAEPEVTSSTGTRSAETGGKDSGITFMEEPGGSSPPPSGKGKESAPRSSPAASGLQAGFADDNRQFNYFLNFLSTYGAQAEYFPIAIQERIVLAVVDSDGKPVPNARISVSAGGRALAEGASYADGAFTFYPSEYNRAYAEYAVVVSALGERRDLLVQRNGVRRVEARLPSARPAYTNVPLDVLFVLDTTGSMGEEIQRLKATIEIINLNLASLSSRPQVRFGLVLYRDRDDEYLTRIVPLTGDLDAFRKSLASVEADGGGDDPEDLQSALRDAMEGIRWNLDGVRLAFVITDAPPHLDYDQDYTYVDAARDARNAGIRIFTVGTGGLDLMGELILRQISQYTGAKYIFLTYGEEGESAGGAPGSVSHHTGSNYQTDKLEAIIIRLAKEELAFLTDQPVTEEGDYFQASRVSGEERAETLNKLFDMAIAQIVDYATFRIPPGTPTGALPLVPQADGQAADAEYFSEQLVLSLSREKAFAVVERKDLQAILKELELQMSGIADEANAARVGRLMNAQLLLAGKMYDKGSDHEIFLKLLRVETGEILSVTRLVVDKSLGLSAP